MATGSRGEFVHGGRAEGRPYLSNLPRLSRVLAAQLESQRKPLSDVVRRVTPTLEGLDDEEKEHLAGYSTAGSLLVGAEEGFRNDHYGIMSGVRSKNHTAWDEEIHNPVTVQDASRMLGRYRYNRDADTSEMSESQKLTNDQIVTSAQYSINDAFANRHNLR